jgi:hypothetical protein
VKPYLKKYPTQKSLEELLKRKSTCLTSMRTCIQTLVLSKKKVNSGQALWLTSVITATGDYTGLKFKASPGTKVMRSHLNQ